MLKNRIALIVLMMLGMMQFAMANDGGISIKAGANFSKNGFIADDTKFQPGLTLGLTYEKKMPKIFGFEIGVQYHWKRSSADGFDVDSINFDNFKNAFHFLEIPATLKFYPFDWLNVNIGPYISYIIAAKAEGIENGEINTWNLISDPEYRGANGEDFLNRLDFGFHFGAELITKSGFGFGARYSQGFGDVTNDSFVWDKTLIPPDSEKVRTSSIITYIFYQF